MISINNLSMSFGQQLLLDDISFNIHRRERLGLVGRNGSGKTTLFNLMIRKITPDSGQVVIPKNYTIGYVEQHLKFTQKTVLAEGCLGLPKDQEHDEWKVEKILTGLGFSEEDMQKDPALFSGGYQVRLNLARVLVSEPHLLLLDEPTNYLDISSIRWLTRFLRTWQNELIIITHDRGFMDAVTTHTMIIHRNKVKKVKGGTAKLYDQIAMEEEIYEKTRVKDEKSRKETEAFINRFRAKARLASMAQSRIKALEKKEVLNKLTKVQTLDFAFNAKPSHAKIVMDIHNLSFGYKKDKLLINNLSISIDKQDRICVIGKNGKGKTTLLKLLYNELNPLSGSIKTHPQVEIAYFGQTNIDRLHPGNTIEQELLGCTPGASYKHVRSICGAMMFSGDNALKPISVLSGGEKSRVLLGKLLLSPVNMLLLDEPTNHLDMESCDSLIEAVNAFPSAAIVVTHNEAFLNTLATRLIVFENDNVFVFEGGYQDFLDEVGWADEESISSRKKRPGESIPNNQIRNQTKAEKAKQRSLEKGIKNTEAEIEKLEQEVNTINQKIIDASAKGEAVALSELSTELHRVTIIVDRLYGELEGYLAEQEKTVSA
ncbi:MAG: ABC-F family ATP-binding cassette domain-containing protein [Candidatus Margulisiibacteriota bacterium]